MSDVSDAAPAAVESSPAPEAQPVETPNPISVEPRAPAEEKPAEPVRADKPAEKKPISVRDAIKKASEKVEAEDKANTADPKAKADAKPTEKTPAAKVEAKPAEKPAADQPRTDRGQFAPKADAEGKVATEAAPKPTNFAEPPPRFSPDAKMAWKDAPEPVRAEVHRAVRELTEGYQKHRVDAEAYAEVKDYAELAKKQGTTLKAALSNYIGMEQKLRTDFLGGLEQLCQNRGVSLRDVAAKIMGQKPEEVANDTGRRQDATIRELRQTVQQLQQQIGGVTKTMEQQRSESVMSTVSQFAAQAGHERFDELSGDIKFFLESGRAADLPEAYALAERLNPAPAKQMTAEPAAPAAEAAAQNRNGQKSITGAPSRGSTPAKRAPATSIRESIKRARSAVA